MTILERFALEVLWQNSMCDIYWKHMKQINYARLRGANENNWRYT